MYVPLTTFRNRVIIMCLLQDLNVLVPVRIDIVWSIFDLTSKRGAVMRRLSRFRKRLA